MDGPLASDTCTWSPDTDSLDRSVKRMEISSKHVKDESPKDKYNMVYFLFLFLGMCTLLPFNMFLTASPYFSAKLNGTRWQYTYQNYFLVAYSVPAIVAAAVTVPMLRVVRLKIRMIVSPVILMIIFIFTAVMVKVDTSTWIDTFFTLTIVGIVISNSLGSAIYQSSLFGLASLFPKQYSQSVVSGQALAGIFTSAASILSLLGANDPYESAVFYFISAVVALLVCIISYALLRRIEYAKYHMKKLEFDKSAEKTDAEEESPSDNDAMEKTRVADEKDISVTVSRWVHGGRYLIMIWKQIWPTALSGILCFTITLGVYPAIASRIEPVDKASNSTFLNRFFTPVTCFLTFNVADFVGRFLALWLLQPNYKRGITLLILTLMRIGFIPLFLLMNVQPRSNLPVLIPSDIVYVISLALLGISNGYIISLSMMYGPMRVDAKYAESTGAIMAACLILGLGFGSALSFATVALL
ncbi:Equilibrative nucleoside transporter 3 [Trichoplax sp. H2]|nr:Equilibrative nucleoside transporter 3 [Trichoplax sp. H2]|eukprot:RDD43128.1 Equilibrative nucleoside transporter 3 [Trichoplax sp. H2]